MQFGMPVLIEKKTLEENVALAKELGLSFVELNMSFPQYSVNQLEDVGRFLSAAEEAKIYYTIHLEETMNLSDFNPFVREAYWETVRRTIEVAKILEPLNEKYGDASQPFTLNLHMLHGIYVTLPEKKVWLNQKMKSEYLKNFREFRDWITDRIGGRNIQIAIENTDQGGWTDFEKEAIDVMLESPKFGLTWDIGHSFADREIDTPFLWERRNRICHFHIHDARTADRKPHLAIGDGEMDIREKLKLANELDCHAVLEIKTEEALRKSWSHPWVEEFKEK